MIFGSLFAGIGGIDLGLERAGMECAWQVEIDEFCLKVLNKHWPDVPKYKDVYDVGKENLETVDLIAGGFPCQPHSVAGKQLGEKDDRNLWPEFIRIVRETKPRYVLAENVLGIITTYLDTVLSDLEGEGYATWPFTFSACGFDVPHRRERIFVVAYTEGDIRGTSGYDRPKPLDGSGSLLADTSSKRLEGSKEAGSYGKDRKESSNELAWGCDRRGQTNWTVEPNVGRVAHGVPSRVDRLRGLGNAVVPQVAEWIGRRILEFDGLPMFD